MSLYFHSYNDPAFVISVALSRSPGNLSTFSRPQLIQVVDDRVYFATAFYEFARYYYRKVDAKNDLKKIKKQYGRIKKIESETITSNQVEYEGTYKDLTYYNHRFLFKVEPVYAPILS